MSHADSAMCPSLTCILHQTFHWNKSSVLFILVSFFYGRERISHCDKPSCFMELCNLHLWSIVLESLKFSWDFWLCCSVLSPTNTSNKQLLLGKLSKKKETGILNLWQALGEKYILIINKWSWVNTYFYCKNLWKTYLKHCLLIYMFTNAFLLVKTTLFYYAHSTHFMNIFSKSI